MMAMDSGSGHSGDGGRGNRQSEMAEMRFQEEIQSLIRQNLLGDDNSNNNNNNNSSFTALLGLAPNQAMELLHNPHHEIAIPVPVQIEAYGCVGAAVEQNQGPVTPKFVDFPQFRCSPTFPSNAALVERAARYSVFASEGSSPETSVVPSNSGNNSSPLVKSEPAVSDSDPPPPKSQPKRAKGKRKEPEKNKAKGGGKKTKTGDDGVEENNNGGMGGGEKLPYVHVRARRGQATDSHSLAERARREKINARMKLLQELVPGCSKISGTALVLDEIINHVQSLQRQVEFLSMKLAAVNPRIDFGGLDSFLAPENTRVTGCNGGGVVGLEGSMWPEINLDGVRRQQQIWQVDLLSSSQQQPSSSMWDRDDDDDNHQHHGFITSGPLLFGLDSSTNPASLHPNQLKTEI